MKIGVIIPVNKNIKEEMKKVRGLGIETCQINCWNEDYFTQEMADLVLEAARENNIQITALWCGWPGPKVWDFYAGPATLGLVPSAYRFQRMQAILKGSDFAKLIGVQDIITHVGFIPENPRDPEYSGVVDCISYIAKYCKKNDQYFLFETGQETPITIIRVIEDTGMDNLGINLDPANLLMYGKANPVDAIDVFGKYVRGVHAKDGEYPTNGKSLGHEKALGEGRVNFAALIKKLHEVGYKGALTIEREISGEKQIQDIIKGKELLQSIIDGL